MSRQLATVEITLELLEQVLHLPPGVFIVGVGCHDGVPLMQCSGRLVLTLCSSQFAEVQEGAAIPTAEILYRRQQEIVCEIKSPSVKEEADIASCKETR